MEKDFAITEFGEYYASRKVEADRKAARAKMQIGSGKKAPDFVPGETVVQRFDRLFATIEPVLEDGNTPSVIISGEHNGNIVETDLSLSVIQGSGFKILDAQWTGQPPTSFSSSKKLYHHESIDRGALGRRMTEERLANTMTEMEKLAWSVHEYMRAIDVTDSSEPEVSEAATS